MISKRKYILILVLVVLAFGIPKLVIHDSTKHTESKICVLHNAKMKGTIVGTNYGLGCINDNTLDYPNAKAAECMGCVVPIWPTNRLAKTYYCKACNKLKKAKQYENLIP